MVTAYGWCPCVGIASNAHCLQVEENWVYTFYPFDEQRFRTGFTLTDPEAGFKDCLNQSNYGSWNPSENEVYRWIPSTDLEGVQGYRLGSGMLCIDYLASFLHRFLLSQEWGLRKDWLQLSDRFNGMHASVCNIRA